MVWTDTQRLDWVLAHNPEFDDGFLRIWLGSLAAADLGLSGGSGFYIAEGKDAREQIDSAMNGDLEHAG